MTIRYLLGLVILLATMIASAAPSERHVAWCRAAVASLPVFHEDRDAPGKAAELALIADEAAKASLGAPRPPREWAALILTVWKHESNLSSRIIRNECKAYECDRGKARGGGQVHRNSLNAADWDASPGNVAIQIKMTDDALRRAHNTCARSGVPWDVGTLNAYAGKMCSADWLGLHRRLLSLDALKRVSVPSGGAS
jgi:hypothetical protein